jgi:hypothetical protein
MSNQAKTVEIEKIKINCMSTCDIHMKIKGMRKFQEFSVYPISKGETEPTIKIQSDTRFGILSLKDGKGLMSKSHQNGGYSHHLQMDKLTPFLLNNEQLEQVKKEIINSSKPIKSRVGVITDNSGASLIALT